MEHSDAQWNDRYQKLIFDLATKYREMSDGELRRLHIESLVDDLDRETSDRRFQSQEVGDAAVEIALHREASRRYKRSARIWNRLARRKDFRKWEKHFSRAHAVVSQTMAEVVERGNSSRGRVNMDDHRTGSE